MVKKLLPEEREWGALRSFYRPAYIKFLVGLSQATKGYETGKLNGECAAVAIAATIAYVRALNEGGRLSYLLPPLEQALEIVEAGIDPASLPYCRRAQAIVSDIDAHKGRPLVPLDDFVSEKRLSKVTSVKILASVALEYQLLNKVKPLDRALKNVVGGDSSARKRLKDFRYNMKQKDSPKGARKEFDLLMRQIKQETTGAPPEMIAELTLDIYKNSVGKKS